MARFYGVDRGGPSRIHILDQEARAMCGKPCRPWPAASVVAAGGLGARTLCPACRARVPGEASDDG